MPSERISPGGTAITARPLNCHNWPVVTATSGTDTTPVAGTVYYTSIYVPGDMFITNINVLLGSASTNGNVLVALYNEGGSLLANSALAGVVTGTAATVQAVPLTVPYLATGPRYLIVGVSFANTSDRFRSVPAQCSGGILGGSVTGVFGTLANPITISATNFTADKAPVVFPS